MDRTEMDHSVGMQSMLSAPRPQEWPVAATAAARRAWDAARRTFPHSPIPHGLRRSRSSMLGIMASLHCLEPCTCPEKMYSHTWSHCGGRRSRQKRRREEEGERHTYVSIEERSGTT